MGALSRDPLEWANHIQTDVKSLLLVHGAVPIRGLRFVDWPTIESVGSIFVEKPMNYADRSTPRSTIYGYLVTSTKGFTTLSHCNAQ